MKLILRRNHLRNLMHQVNNSFLFEIIDSENEINDFHNQNSE